jgi:formaldehyde-activating enzyme involved in methanogenesis
VDKQLLKDSALNEQPSVVPNLTNSNGREDLDIETLVEQIWLELDGAVDRAVIEQVVQEVLPRFDDARVKSFVPIFIRKEAKDRLKRIR